MTRAGIGLSDWAVLSSIGMGRADFSAAVRRATVGRGRLPLLEERGLDRLSALAVRTADDLLGAGRSVRPARTAVVLGATMGSLPRLVEMAADSQFGRTGYDLRPASIPSSMPNVAAGQVAIRHRLAGPNTTVASGPLSGLVSLSVAARFLKLGHADVVVAGAVEELSMPRLIGDRLTRDRGERRLAPLGEGCVLMLLQPSPDDVGAAFLGARYGSAATATATASASASASVSVNDQRVLLGELITELLNSHNLTGTDIDLVSLSQCASARLGEAERRAVESALDGRSARTVAVPELVGETYSAASAFQVAAALALGEKYSVVTVLGPGGEAAAALLRHGNVKAGL